MEHQDKKLKLDLDFLGKDAPEKSEKKHEAKEHHKPEHKKTEADKPADGDAGTSDSAKWIIGSLVAAGIIIAIAVSATSGGSTETASTQTNTLPPPANTKTLDEILDTSKTGNSYVPVADRAKTANQTCKDEYGSQSYSTGEKDSSGDPICDCNDGYQWNSAQTACVASPAAPIVPKQQTPLEICQERNGYNATYDSATNSCGCASGYSLGSSNQCVSLTVARDQQCSAKFPGTSWLKNDPADGHSICDCVAGSYWNNERTACYTLSAYTQSCVNSFGTGAVSTTENNKRVCDCGYGYDFNPSRTMCVTTASINAICERDVGRNSRYSGSSTDGKYNCTEPY